MNTVMEMDDNMHPMQGVINFAVPFAKLTAAASAVRNATAFTHSLVRVTTTAAMNFKVGDSSVTATANDHYIPANTSVLVPMYASQKYISVYGTGDVYFSEMGD